LNSLGAKDRFFLWLHYYDPHALYDPPPRFRDLYPGRPYEAEIAYADDAFGEVLRALDSAGRTESTVVVVTAGTLALADGTTRDWSIAPAEPKIIFDEDRDKVWDSAYSQRTQDL
jgi:membrane-anchored protein YejM (alkaline phosphatase superfamily)